MKLPMASLPVSLAIATLFAGSVVACSSQTIVTPAPAADPTEEPTAPDAAPAEAQAPDAGPPSACAPPPKASDCKNESAWVRGVAKFDPKRYEGKKAPTLRVILRHSFVVFPEEATIGGRLHAFTSVPVTDVSKGEVPFALDLCAFGTAMWSEENGTFHVILILDENDNNDLSKQRSNAESVPLGTPDKGELVKMVDVDVSCHAASPCLEVTLDCADGDACTTITPMKSCKKKTPGCTSDSVFCG